MPYIEFEQRFYRLRDGENVLGSGEPASIRLPELGEDFRLTIGVDNLGAFAWTAGDDGRVVLNGRPLSREPIPLFHGDHLSMNGSTIVFIDDGGEPTVKMDRAAPAAVAKTLVEAAGGATAVEADLLRRVTPPEPEQRIVAVLRRLDNNQAYVIDRAGFRIGREKRSDLIIPDRSVSRLHAEITYNRGQYLLRCLGRTSTRVNGRAIDEPHKLQVGDVIQIGSYEFAFARRPMSAEEITSAAEITPIRSAIPDAPTMGVVNASGSRLLTWLIVIIGAGLAVAMLLT